MENFWKVVGWIIGVLVVFTFFSAGAGRKGEILIINVWSTAIGIGGFLAVLWMTITLAKNAWKK